jgi:DNA-binding NtrC family response regulator
MAARILIIDDDEGYAKALGRLLGLAGHEVVTIGTAAEAKKAASTLAPDVLVIDQRLPDMHGLDLLESLRAELTSSAFVVVTAYPDLDFAVDAMRRGAFDYLAKGSDPRESVLRIERAADLASLKRRVESAQTQVGSRREATLIGQSPAMERLRTRMNALASSHDTTALITGETGVGKGVVARAIFAASARASEPFVSVDCTTIPETLVESELFGHERGAFSGATHAKPGRVEAAGAGTLFLDEIAELDLSVQAKLLRLLEEREYSRIGSNRVRRLEARIIAATNRDLARAVDEGRFRADLRFRLEVFVLDVPPLRERAGDVLLIAEEYAAERARALGRVAPDFREDVRRALLSYPFPGNVRELRNMVEQALLLATGDELSLEEFPVLMRFRAGWQPPSAQRASVRPPAPSVAPSAPASARASFVPTSGLSQAVNALSPASARPSFLEVRMPQAAATLEGIREKYAVHERARLVEALEAHGGNVTRAARHVGLSRFQLLRRLEKYGMR